MTLLMEQQADRASDTFASLRAVAGSTRTALVMLCVALGLASPARAGSTDAANPAFHIGAGTVTGLGTANVTVNQASQLAKIHWDSLGNKAGEVLRYNQPSTGSVALNVIGGADPSQFLGSVFANGSVIFINPNGVFFGPQSQVNVGGLIASSLNLTDTNFVNGRYAFDGSAAAGMVRNEGLITAGPFGVYLLAPNVTNSGIITTPGGQIALGAGTTAYLSNRADGRGFLTEVTAPAGDALNVGRMIADGGQVSMIGRLVTQSGLVQANTVRQQNGKIELVASDRIALTAGSVTKAQGDDQVSSDGGTILVKSNLTTGQTEFSHGAVIDVSGGVQGGNGGFAEVSGSSVSLGGRFLAGVAQGYRGGRFLIDPTVGTQTVSTSDLESFSGSGASDVEFRSPAGTDLTVSVSYYNLAPVFDPDSGALLSGWALPAGQTGFLRFTAGNNLIFSPNTIIQNGASSGASAGLSTAKWSYVLKADNDILFNSTKLFTGGGGSLSLDAVRDIKLVPDAGGGHTILQTFTGGNLSIIAGRNLIAPSAFQGGIPGPSNQYSGIRLEGIGNLDITTRTGDFWGGIVNGQKAGPGFVLSSGTATLDIGGSLGSSDNYANVTVGTRFADGTSGKTTVDVTAQNNIYLGLVQDRGVADRIPGQTPTLSVTAHPESSVSLFSRQGDIHLSPPSPGPGIFGDVRRRIYPASLIARAPGGNIFFESLLQFWPSPVGTLQFAAGQSILGSQDAGIALDCPSTCNPITNPASQTVSPITLSAGGDISGLSLHLIDSYRKRVTISAGGDITRVSGRFAVPDYGRDQAGQLIPAVSISARRIDFSGQIQGDTNSGFTFGGNGLVRVTVREDLNLGQSQGLRFVFDAKTLTTEGNKGGLLDVAVGGNLLMTQSSIRSDHGASVFIHGLNAGAPIAGSSALATSATLGVTTVNGQRVLAVGGVPIVGQDGRTLIPVNDDNQVLVGNVIYMAGGKAVLDIAGLPVAVEARDSVVGQRVLLVNGQVALGSNGKPVSVETATSSVITSGDLVHNTAVLDRPLVQLADGTVVAVINGKTVLGTLSGTAAIDGRPSVGNGGVTLSVDGRAVQVVVPVGGAVNVGSKGNAPNVETGILTVRGGAIDLKATGNVDVNLSRIATLGGGNITVTSTTGDINAGSGARGDVTQFPISEVGPNGTIVRTFFQVPGSGIFTIHPQDGNLPNIPAFNPISPFEAEVLMHQLFGHDVSSLEPLIPAAREAWKNQYDQSVRQLFAGFRLGDIRLTAGHDVIVPPAGIRGRNITIEAGHNLELQGGEIRGILNAQLGGVLKGPLSSITGAFVIQQGFGSNGTPGQSLGLGNITGNVGNVTTTSSVTASASTTSLTLSKAAAEATSSQRDGESKTVSDRGKKKGDGQLAAGSLRVRDKVKIKVETKQEPAM